MVIAVWAGRYTRPPLPGAASAGMGSRIRDAHHHASLPALLSNPLQVLKRHMDAVVKVFTIHR